MTGAERDRIRCALMRGGTSRGAFFLKQDLPALDKSRDEILLALFGNPDPFQVNGIGGGTPWTSLAALVSKAEGGLGDVEVSFGRVIPGSLAIDYSTLSADLAAAAAQYAVDEKLVKAVGPSTVVRLVNDATSQSIRVQVPVKGGRARVDGKCVVAGVPGAGACIKVTLPDLATDHFKLLPTGRVREGVATSSGEYVVSIVNAAAPVVFVNAASLGLVGTELPAQLESDAELLDRVETIRSVVAQTIGLASQAEGAKSEMLVSPRLVTVFESVEHTDLSGRFISVMDADLVCREATLGAFHYAIDAEVAVCTAVAAHIEGSVVFDALLREEAPRVVRIAHPAGVISIEVDVEKGKDGYVAKCASFETTARRIMDGEVLR